MLDVPAPAGDEIVEADHGRAVGDQPVAQVRADESGAAGDQRNLFTHLFHATLLAPP